MTYPVYTVGGGGSQSSFPPAIIAARAPINGIDIVSPSGAPYQGGQSWIDTADDSTYQFTSGGIWALTGGSSSTLDQLTGDSGTALPAGGSIKIAGTANQVTTSASGAIVTIGLPSAVQTGSFTTTPATTATTLANNGLRVTGTNPNTDLVLSSKGTGQVFVDSGSMEIASAPAVDTAIGLTIQNTQGGNTTANAFVDIAVNATGTGGFGAGIPYLRLHQTAVSKTFSFYLENIDNNGDLVIANSSTLNNLASVRQRIDGASGSITFPGVASTGGLLTKVETWAQNATALGANFNAVIKAGSSATADPYSTYTVEGGTTWAVGQDQSATAAFVISKNATLGTNNYLVIDTSGNLTAPAGNMIMSTAGKGLQIHEGANARMGTSVLAAGSSSAISNTSVTATTRIFLQRIAINGSTALGDLTYVINPGVSFTVTSVQPGTPGSPETGDSSTFNYLLIEPSA